jgi:hypothetical protein
MMITVTVTISITILYSTYLPATNTDRDLKCIYEPLLQSLFSHYKFASLKMIISVRWCVEHLAVCLKSARGTQRVVAIPIVLIGMRHNHESHDTSTGAGIVMLWGHDRVSVAQLHQGSVAADIDCRETNKVFGSNSSSFYLTYNYSLVSAPDCLSD